MPDTNDPNLIWIEDAAKEYERSRSWLDQQVSAGQLTYVKIPGDRKTYLLRSELDRLIRPRQGRRGGADETGSGSDEGQQSAG